MKIYRCSFWKANTTVSCVIPMSIMFILISPIMPSFRLFLYYFLFIVLLIPLFITQYFYVTLEDDELTIKNGYLSFWKSSYRYNDIIKVRLVYPGGLNRVYMQVTTKNKKGIKYVIDLVHDKQYRSLIKDLEDRGIEVENKIGSMMPTDHK